MQLLILSRGGLKHRRNTPWPRDPREAGIHLVCRGPLRRLASAKENRSVFCPPSLLVVIDNKASYVHPRPITIFSALVSRRRSPIRFPLSSLNIFNWPNPFNRTMVLGTTQPLTEISTRNLPGDKGRPAPKAENLTSIFELNV
jgi:hypothetical protein